MRGPSFLVNVAGGPRGWSRDQARSLYTPTAHSKKQVPEMTNPNGAPCVRATKGNKGDALPGESCVPRHTRRFRARDYTCARLTAGMDTIADNLRISTQRMRGGETTISWGDRCMCTRKDRQEEAMDSGRWWRQSCRYPPTSGKNQAEDQRR